MRITPKPNLSITRMICFPFSSGRARHRSAEAMLPADIGAYWQSPVESDETPSAFDGRPPHDGIVGVGKT
jgi:hypothetical protein